MNALDTVRLAFSGLDAMRQQVTPDVRVYNIITHGGDAPNIVPKGASMHVFLRASTKKYFNDSLVLRAKNIFEGAALMTGAKVEIRETAKAYENMITNERLAERFGDHSKRIGRTAQPIE